MNNKNNKNTIPADYRVKLKENEKKNKYIYLVRKLKKKSWNIKVTIIPIVIAALDTVPNGLIQEQLHYWDLPEYWKEFCRLGEIFFHSNFFERLSDFYERLSGNADVKSLKE